MKVLIIGKSGHAHAIAHCLHQNSHQVICLPGKKLNSRELVDFTKQEEIDLTVIDASLADEVADSFSKRALNVFAPVKQGAILEKSHVWAKEFMAKYQIPTPPFYISESAIDALEHISSCFKQWESIVIKAGGPVEKKETFLCSTPEEAKNAIYLVMEKKIFEGDGRNIVIEKMLKGHEVSVAAFCDGQRLPPLLPCYNLCGKSGREICCPVPFLSEYDLLQIQEQIVGPTLAGLKKESIDYRGMLSVSLIVTEGGPKVLRYYCRFKEPETQAMLPLLESDLGDIMLLLPRC